jgi:hypothetical protein
VSFFCASLLVTQLWLSGGVARAFAYLDPGSGSFFIQLLVAGLMGALFLAGVYWRRVRNFFRRLTGGEPEDDDGEDQE